MQEHEPRVRDDETRTLSAEEGEEIQDEARRRGSRRAAGADTPAGPDTDRTVIPAKRDIERQEQEGKDRSGLFPSGPNV